MGIYGTVSYIVVLRTREVGIRMAIGAQKRDVLGLILRESARPVFAGLVADFPRGWSLLSGARPALWTQWRGWRLLGRSLALVHDHCAPCFLPTGPSSDACRSDGGAQIRISPELQIA